MNWQKSHFRILGITFTLDLREITKINYESKLEEIKQLINSWSKRILFLIGKNIVIKTLALPNLNHLIIGLPNPKQDIIKSIQSLIFKFIWNNKPDKIKRNVMVQNYDNGGIKTIDLNNFISAL